MLSPVEVGPMHSGAGAGVGAFSRGYLSVMLAKPTSTHLTVAARLGPAAIPTATVSNSPGDVPCDVTDLSMNLVPW